MNSVCRFVPVLLLLVFASTGLAQETGTDSSAAATQDEALTAELKAARDLFVQALQATGRDRLRGLQQAYNKLEQAVSGDPDLPPARTIWAKFLVAAGDPKGARSALQRATTEHATDPEAFVLLANLAAMGGNLTEARLTYNEARRLVDLWREDHPRRKILSAQIAAGRASVAEARSVMAAQNQRDDLEERYNQVALSNLREWAAIEPLNFSAHERLGNALFRAGEVDAAVEAFDTARRLNPKVIDTNLRLAKLYFAQSDRAEARSRLEAAIAAEPEDVTVSLVAADQLMAMGSLDAARIQIDKVLEADQENRSGQLLLAQWQRFQGDYSAAAERLQVLSVRHPSDFEIANLLAMTLSELDSAENRRRAVAVASVNAQRFGDLNTAAGKRARVTLTWAAFADGQTEAAKNSLNQLLAVGIQSNQITGDEAYFAARLLVEFGRPELALALIKAALQRADAFPKRSAAEELQSQLM